jgi:tRNA threonylcarbamoyladenosine biosynthesis protein TsaB
MIILAADTSAPAGSVAVTARNGGMHARQLDPGLTHSETLLPAVAWVLDSAGLSREDVTALAVGTGPGAFTGLRVGLATFKGWAAAAGLPIAPVPSLDALALTALNEGLSVLVLSDARKGEIYAAAYPELDPEGLPRCEKGPSLLKPSELASWGADLEAVKYTLAGTGSETVSGLLEALPFVAETGGFPYAPAAKNVLEIGRKMLEKGDSVQAEGLLPFYLRPPDAIPPSRGIVK